MSRKPIALLLSGALVAAALRAPASTAEDGGREPAAPEAWADPGLKVTRGLALWLDAGRLGDARRAHGAGAVRDGEKVDTWYDASGHRRHLTRPPGQSPPTFQGGAIRFDGASTALELAGAGLDFEGVTLFVVATPFANPGGFRAFLAMNREGRNDFSSGLTVDLGPAPGRRFAALNAEGSGFLGAANLLKDASDFGAVRRIAVSSAPGPGGTRLDLDGRFQGARDRSGSALRMDRLSVGARRYNNEGGAPDLRGFLDGDILEVLVYDRLLSESERAEVERYLAARHGGKTIASPRRPSVGKPLVTVADPPPVQMMVPGFTVRQLPVDLSNVNNVKYRADGTLVALAYDGNIDLLSDVDGDGLEETVRRFWENHGELVAPIGMALTPPGDRHGNGVFVACKGKVSLVVDTDGDDKADKEIIVARGWEPIPHGVDALGVALDRAGHVYFGLGAADYANPYQVDRSGRARYDLKSERGTIQKVAPDFRARETVATGIRFPVALAFNRHGDLFATDQEGATWLANGNPFDELLHIQPGRHYGFPPRHPKHLPDVVDEPSVSDYGPQHQSACGLNFNEPVHGGPTFGPPWWAGDALVSGYSRGKVFRTALAKTPAGYVAKDQVLACLDMLTADACVSPKGRLVVAAHSGLPDWGSGPSGRGRLYQVTYRGGEPQPVLTWAAGPQEVRIAFDRPLDPARLRDLARRTAIEYGRYVRPGDRFETLSPGYESVARQAATPRFDLPVLSAQVSDDRRELLLATAPHPEAVSYAVTLRGLARVGTPDAGAAALRQEPDVDLGYDLGGVTATWRPESGGDDRSAWLPHLDLTVARAFTAGSAGHDRFWEASRRPGRLTLRTRLDLVRMLRPDVQPGSTLDHTPPDEEVTLTFSADGPVEVTTPAGTFRGSAVEGGRHHADVAVRPKAGEPLPVEVALGTGGRTALDVAYTTREDARPRALPLRRFLLPWAPGSRREAPTAVRVIPELEGGDWVRGRAVFHGEAARCSTCHQVRGRGGRIGPDLSNLVHRDYASVLRDIRSPGAAVNPDYVAHAVALRDGRVLQGTLRTEGDRLFVGDSAGRQTEVGRAEVEETAPLASASVMPEGLDRALGPARLRDLLTFLLTEPVPPPPPLDAEGAPPPRRRSEVEAVLAGSRPVADPRPLRVVLAAGPKDHGPGEHDYPLWQRRWSALLAAAENVNVGTADGWPTAEQLATADLIVFYSNNPGWSAARAAPLDHYLARGGGLVYVHYAVDGHDDAGTLADRIGLAWRGGASRFRHGALEVDFRGSAHPITRGFGKLSLVDESYWGLVGDAAGVEVLGTGTEEGAPRPLFWTRRRGAGRVFVSIPGHYTWTFDDPLFRVLLLRGMAWAAGEPVDRFDEQAVLGARLGD